MKRLSILMFALCLLIISCTAPFGKNNVAKSHQQNPEITIEEIAEHIQYLASDELKGRYPGTAESKLAQDYLINQYKLANIAPLGSNGYIQSFSFVNAVVLGEDNHLFIGDTDHAVSDNYIPLGFSANGELTAETVFVGFGFAIDDSIKWNDYGSVSVEGKWAIILRGGPDDDNPHSEFNAHLPLRKKALVAQDNNAAGVLFISQYSDEEDELIPLKYDNSFAGASIPVLHINHTVAEQLFTSAPSSLESTQDLLMSRRQPHSFNIPNVSVSATVDLEKTTAEATNIAAVIPGNDPVLKNEYVIIGAHYDHLGMGGPDSGSRTPDTLAIHNGADDNASGTAGVLEIAELLKSMQPELKRSIVVVNFDAEERGLLGSKHFIKNPLIKLDNIAAMLNLDMIGHLEENRLTIGGTGTSPVFKELLTNINQNYNIDLKMSSEGYGPSDHASFYTKDIPVLFFFTGTHDDCHKPTDDFTIINLAGEKTIADFIIDVVVKLNELPEKPEFTEAGPKESTTPSRRFKVTFGVIPAYGSEVVGMEIDGVKKDGQADIAGMQKGDIITAIDGKEIKNIYDYMYRLGELKKGQAVVATVLRGQEVLELSLEL